MVDVLRHRRARGDPAMEEDVTPLMVLACFWSILCSCTIEPAVAATGTGERRNTAASLTQQACITELCPRKRWNIQTLFWSKQPMNFGRNTSNLNLQDVSKIKSCNTLMFFTKLYLALNYNSVDSSKNANLCTYQELHTFEWNMYQTN